MCIVDMNEKCRLLMNENHSTSYINTQVYLYEQQEYPRIAGELQNLIARKYNISAESVCECLSVDSYEQIYKYSKADFGFAYKKREIKGLSALQNMLFEVGWEDSIFFSSEYLSRYELKIAPDLQNVTIISHQLTQDSPGGVLWDVVANNLSNGVHYNYIFLDSDHAYGTLRKIKNGHTVDNQRRLLLEIAEDSFWALGTYSNVTIYEFKNGRISEGYIRVKVNTKNNIEYPVYLRMSEPFVDVLWNHVGAFRANGKIKEYIG